MDLGVQSCEQTWSMMLYAISSSSHIEMAVISSFRVGAEDAEHLETKFEPLFRMEDFANLACYDFYLKLMVDETASPPFSGTALSPVTVGLSEAKYQIWTKCPPLLIRLRGSTTTFCSSSLTTCPIVSALMPCSRAHVNTRSTSCGDTTIQKPMPML